MIRLVLLAALSGFALFADFAAGLRAYQNKDYQTAVKEWRPLAESGDAPSQFNLGLMYLDGTGVPQSNTEAVEWFRRSADQGYAKAQYNLGEMYLTGNGVKKNLIVAHMWLNICAAAGDANCAAHRDSIAGKMKRKDLEEAQHRAAAFKPEHAK